MTKPNRQKCDLLLEKYLLYMKVSNFSSETIWGHSRNIRYFFDYLEELEDIENLVQVTRQTIQEYQTFVCCFETKKGRHLSAPVQRRRIATVNSFFDYLLSEDILLTNPIKNVALPKIPESLPHSVLTKKEAFKILELPDLDDVLGIRDRAILELLYSTGIRVQELINLTIFDVEIEQGTVRINNGKSAKDRVVPCGEIALDFLEKYLREVRPKLISNNGGARCNMPIPTKSTQVKTCYSNDVPFLFVTKSGRKFIRSNMQKLVTKYGKKSGIKKSISCHTWRHTCATHLLKGKADIRHIQEILGHRSIATTQIYTKVELTDLKKVHAKYHPRP